jgi:serine protease Do
VTVGIISGTGRHLGQGLTAIEDFIQTDAAINQGNSGGPLLNIAGEVIGINTAIIDPSRAQGVGFAVPINMAKEVLDSVTKHGKVIRGWLGVIIQPVNEEIAEAFKLPDRKGALVSDITPGGPAEKAGIEKGDVIREVDGKAIDSVDSLTKFVRRLEVGKEVPVRVIRRGGEEKTLKVTIGEMPEEGGAVTAGGKTAFGLTIEDSSEGVVVTGVEPGSPAGTKIRRGDILLEINGKSIKNVADYNKAISSIKENENLVFLLKRGDYTIFVVIKPKK